MFSPAGQKRRLSLQVDFVLRTGKWETCKANETSKGEYLVGMVRDRLTIIHFAQQAANQTYANRSPYTYSLSTGYSSSSFSFLFSLSLSPSFFSSFLVFLVSFQSSSQSVDFAH